MAEMSFVITCLNGAGYTPEKVLSYEWSKDIDAPCDALRLTFLCENEPAEAEYVDVYCENEHVMHGFIDVQRFSDGKAFIYARSSACVLIDNEAPLLTYTSPCVNSLFALNAQPFGFKNGLENYYVNAEYTVGKGTSCYGAINSFVSVFTNRRVAVSPEGELYVPSGSTKYIIERERIISELKTVNRGRAVSRIDYKTDGEYNRHFRSRALEKRGINRSRKINLSSAPEWRRSKLLENIINKAARGYISARIELSGISAAELYSPVVCSGYEDYYIASVRISLDKNGEKTVLTLYRDFGLEEEEYVA